MNKEEILKKKQEELDDEEMEPCPLCGSPRTWGEIREVGCMECYYQDYIKEQDNKKNLTPLN